MAYGLNKNIWSIARIEGVKSITDITINKETKTLTFIDATNTKAFVNYSTIFEMFTGVGGTTVESMTGMLLEQPTPTPTPILIPLQYGNNANDISINNPINNPIRYSPTTGEKIVDQSALSQYNRNNYLHFDAFNFHGDYQGNNNQ